MTDSRVDLLAHAKWMVKSGQYRGTVREYLGCLHPSPYRDEALKRLDATEDAETTAVTERGCVVKTRVIFLDIDGVLNSTRYWDANKPLPMGQAGAIDPEAVARLNRIVAATHADVVLSSSWRTMGWELVARMLRERGFVGVVNGATPIKMGCDRCTEIETWLHEHRYASQWWRFAVLDDDPRAWRHDSDFGRRGRFFPTNYLAGLTDEHVDPVVEWLNDGRHE